MVFWTAIVLLAQAGPPARGDEITFDLARLAPETVHVVHVTTGQTFTAVFTNRAPGARYRLSHRRPSGAGVETYLEPHNPRDDVARSIGNDPGCEEVIGAAQAVVAATDEAQTAQAMAAALPLLDHSPCPNAARALRLLRRKTNEDGFGGLVGYEASGETITMMERLEPGTETAVRRWRFRLDVTLAPLPWMSPSEGTWLAGETARALVDLGQLARRPHGGALPVVDFRPTSNDFDSFSVRVSAPPAPPRTYKLTIYEGRWSPDAYQDLAQAMFAGPRVRAGAAAPPSSLLAHLTDPRTSTLFREAQRVSARITTNPFDAAAHEEAALILGTLGLREAAGPFSDVRLTLSRMTAHLAAAAALRAETPPSRPGVFADLVRKTLLGCQRDVLEALEELTPDNAAERAWIAALRTRNTADWRIVSEPLTATLLERLEYHRALVVSLGGSHPLNAWRRRNAERIPDWGRILLNRHPSAKEFSSAEVATPEPTAEAYAVFLPPLIPLELAEAAEALESPTPLSGAALVDALGTPPGRAVVLAAGRLRAQVIDRGTWARFYQRHLANAIAQQVGRAPRTPADAEKRARADGRVRPDAQAVWQELNAAYSGLELMPVVAVHAARVIPPDPKIPSRSEYAKPCQGASPLWERRPEILTAANWDMLTGTCEEVGRGSVLAAPEKWFGPAPPNGTAFDARARVGMLSKDLALLQMLRSIAPRDKSILSTYFSMRYAFRGEGKAFDEVFDALADYDLGVMTRRASFLTEEPNAFLPAMRRVAEIEPSAWLVLARYLLQHDRDDDAASAFQKAVDVGDDPITVSTQVQWLAEYYLDHHQEEEAQAVGEKAAATLSATGLYTRAHVEERLGRWEEAERHFQELASRYPAQRDALQAFYIRYEHVVGDGRYREEARLATESLFPRGLVRLEPDALTRPPTAGVRIRTTTPSLEKLGLAAGAVIVAVDGYRADSAEQYRALRSWSSAEYLSLTVWNGGAYRTVDAPVRRPSPVFTYFSHVGPP